MSMNELQKAAISLTHAFFTHLRVKRLDTEDIKNRKYQVNSFDDMLSVVEFLSRPVSGNYDHDKGEWELLSDIEIRLKNCDEPFCLRGKKENVTGDLYVYLPNETRQGGESYTHLFQEAAKGGRNFKLYQSLDCFYGTDEFRNNAELKLSAAYWFAESIRHRCFFVLLLCTLINNHRNKNSSTLEEDLGKVAIAWNRKGWGMFYNAEKIDEKHPINLLSDFIKNKWGIGNTNSLLNLLINYIPKFRYPRLLVGG